MKKRIYFISKFFLKGIVIIFILSPLLVACNLEGDIEPLRQRPVENTGPSISAPGMPVIIVADSSLTVRWTAVGEALRYDVYISTEERPPATPEKTVLATTTVLDGLVNKTAYYVWVKAVDETRSSGFSPRARGIPWPYNEIPDTPERPVITPGINQLTVNWEGTGGAFSYEVYINTAPITPSTPDVVTDKTSAVINNLENDVIYYIWVLAANSAGKSGYSPVESGTPRIPTIAPAAPDRPVLTAGSRELTVSWQAVELTSAYEVWFGTSSDSAQAQKYGDDFSDTEIIITGLSNEQTHYVWIKAKNVIGTSGFSLPASAKPSAFTVLPETPEMPTVISGNRELSVSWTPAEGALFYEVWIGVTDNPTNAVKKYSTDASVISTTLTNLVNETTYFIWLKAKNHVGASVFSPAASGIPSKFAVPPSALQSTPSVTAGSGQLTINWREVEGATSYEVWLGTTINPTTAVKRGDDVTDLSTVITGLTNDTTYYIWIKAKNDVGTSGFSPSVSGTPSVFAITPQTPAVPSVSIGNGQITVTWTAVEGATAYEIWLGTSNNSTSAVKSGNDVTTSLSSNITGLTNGTTYYFWIKAKNNIGASGFSPTASGKPLGTPGLPTISSAGYRQLLVSWTTVAGADEYEVYYGTGTPTTLAATTSETSTTIIGLTSSMTYYVRLRAKNNTGISDYGPSASGSVSDNERSPGLYRRDDKIGNQNLSAALSYISTNAQTGDDFYIVLGANESISPTTLNYPGKTVGITLIGHGGERTITLASNGSMFTINSGVTLTLDENITLIGRSTNTASLVYLNSGNLVINAGAKISGNTSSIGGGIYVSSNGTLTINGGTISGNTARGGGIYSSGTVTMNGGTISVNIAANQGGGVEVGGGTFTMHGGVISGNTASNYGGGIFVNNGTVTINNGEITNNTAGNGGGISVNNGTVTMNGGEISGNTVNNGDGGGIYAYSGTVTMNGGEISRNTARGGGGIGVSGNGTVTMHGGTIRGNSTSGGGGGVYVGTSGTVTMHGGTISGNTASSSGGGIDVYKGTIIMHGGTISGNTAGAGGGVFVSESDGTIFKKLPSVSGQNSGIIYGSEETGVDTGGTPLKNNNAVSGSSKGRRNTTAWETDHIDTTTGRGLSANGNAPYGE